MSDNAPGITPQEERGDEEHTEEAGELSDVDAVDDTESSQAGTPKRDDIPGINDIGGD